MNSIASILQLLGAITLLVWSVRQVRTGVERAYGAEMKSAIRRASTGLLPLVGVGALAAMLMQSSTAVAMLISGFSSSGMMTGASSLALMLGADIGSALVVWVFSFDLSWLIPLLLTVGGWLFLKCESRKPKQAGRILMGIALTLVSLKMMGEATAPLRESEAIPGIAAFLGDEYMLAFLIGAAFTWLIHSSIASILLIAALATQGVLPMSVAMPLVLGANLGGGLIAFGLTREASAEARRLPTGNLIFRGVGSILALALLRTIAPAPDMFGLDPGMQVVLLHVAFNIALTLCGLPFVPLVAKLVEKLLPPDTDAGVDHPLARRSSALDHAVLDKPRLALASASRELLHIGEIIELMFAPSMKLYKDFQRERVDSLRALDDVVDRAHSEIKLYLAQLHRGVLSEDESRQSMEITGHAINLEHIGDVIAKELFDLAEKRDRKSVRFSEEGWSELTEMHDRVLANMRLAMNVLVSGDMESARQLAEEKEVMRELEQKSRDAHLLRLQQGTQQSIETSDLHLETVRALKQINSLLALIAYPMLTNSGELLGTRLTKGD